MKSLHTRLILSALAGVAMFATPALAQQPHRHSTQLRNDPGYSQMQASPAQHYPNGAARTGTEESIESGAAFNLGY